METELPKKKSTKTRWILGIFTIIVVVLILAFLYNLNKRSQYEVAEMVDGSATPTIDIENFDYLKGQTFKVNEYDEIPDEYQRGIVKTFIDNNFYQPEDISDKYHLTSIKDRAKKVFAFGNFTGQTEENKPDLAFLAESEDFSSSILFIISSKGDVLLKKSYSGDLPIINSYNKGAKIFMDSDKLEVSPEDGLIIKFKYYKDAIVYNQKSKGFDEHRQYSAQDLIDRQNEESYEGEESPEEEVSDSL